jgi:hypothetical protein
MKNLLARDERESAIDRSGDRIGYLVLSYGLLAIVAYRSFVGNEASWELLGLVVLGGLVGAGYRIANRAMTHEAMLVVGITLVVAFALAVVVALSLG